MSRLSYDTCRCLGVGCDEKFECLRFLVTLVTPKEDVYFSYSDNLSEGEYPCCAKIAVEPENNSQQ